jgi:hypothetical protein
MAFDLPRYCVIFDRAVKVVPTEGGGSRVLVYNELKDEFEDPPAALARYFPNDEAELVTEEQFNAYVDKLRAKGAAKRGRS